MQNLEAELANMNDQIDSLSRENGLANISAGNSIFSGLDQADQTQFNLVKSFSAYLNTQLELKKESFHKAKLVKTKFTCYEKNLEKFVELGLKYKADTCKTEASETVDSQDVRNASFVETVDDLANRIESIKSIEDSIQNCLHEMTELNNGRSDLLLLTSDHARYRTKLDIESKVLQPLSSHRADLKQFVSQWRQFNCEFDSLKNFLINEIHIDQLQNELKNSYFESSQCQTDDRTGHHVTLESDFQKYALLRNKLDKYLSENNDFFQRGAMLLDASGGGSQRLCSLAPSACKDFIQTSELINETSRYLEEKYDTLSFACRSLAKTRVLETDLDKVKCELSTIEKEVLHTNDAGDLKLKLEKTNDLKKRLKSIVNEKNYSKNLLSESEATNSANLAKLDAAANKYTCVPRNNLENSIDVAMMRLNGLEV